jgi:hypothetical protein
MGRSVASRIALFSSFNFRFAFSGALVCNKPGSSYVDFFASNIMARTDAIACCVAVCINSLPLERTKVRWVTSLFLDKP